MSQTVKMNFTLNFCFALLYAQLIGLIGCWDGKIVFADEFDGNQLDTKKWNIEKNCAPYNNELQCYTDRSENIRVNNGFLTIEAKPENYRNKNYTSARITQKSSLTSYGAYVFRAKLPNGAFLWPALWTLFADGCKYEEIDIVEYRGQKTNMIEFAGHFGRDWAHLKSNGSYKEFANTDFSAGFHEFALLWVGKSLQWYVDNVKVFEVSKEKSNWINDNNKPCPSKSEIPFHEATRIIMNVAIGGNFFPKKVYGKLTPQIAQKWSSPRLEVDWVRIYQA